MAMREFRAAVIAACAPAAAFAWVADHRNVPAVLEGITRWDPLQSRTTGEGTRWDVEMRTLGIPLRNVLLIDRWEAPRRISWHSESGLIRQRGGWTFTDAPGGTRIELRIAYEAPGGGLGNALASRADGMVRRRLESALAGMRDRLEGGE